MNNPSLIYRSIAFSAFIHILLFVIALVVIKQSNIPQKTEPYIVSLVDDLKISSFAPAKGNESQNNTPRIPEPVKQKPDSPSKISPNEKLQQEKFIQERIEALRAKKKIEKMVALRKVIDVSGQNTSKGVEAQKSQIKTPSSGTADKSTIGSDYYSMIVKKIRQEWVFPESLDRNLEAIISIRILKDGTIKIERIEKSSGNPLFDRYALRAINKANPLPPPPQEMEVGVRFYP